MPRLLFQQFPELRRNLPWMLLADLPSPVEKLTKLGGATGMNEVWIKRDDKNSELYGGNKARKFEFLFADARAKGKTEVVTSGSDGSNHGAATSIFANNLGMDVTMACAPQPVLSYVRENILVNAACGTKMIHAGNEPAMLLAILKYFLKCKVLEGRSPYFMYFGGSSPLGTIGFVEAALELAKQVKDGELPCPKYLFLPTGSCGTHAGLEIGLRLAGLPTKVVGVRIVPKLITNRHVVANLANRTIRLLQSRCGKFPAMRVRAKQILLLDDYFGGQYGRPTPECKDAINLLGQTEKIPLDPTYSGKGFAGMLGFLKENRLADTPVLYWLTLNTCDLTKYTNPAPDISWMPVEIQQYFQDKLYDPEL